MGKRVKRKICLREDIFYDNFGGMKRKNPHALAMVRQRMKKLSPERRSEIAKNAAKQRWDRVRAAAVA
jgi:hypothetical protein